MSSRLKKIVKVKPMDPGSPIRVSEVLHNNHKSQKPKDINHNQVFMENYREFVYMQANF